MKNAQQILRRVRVVMGLAAALIFFLTVLLPPVLGMLTRQAIIGKFNEWQTTLHAQTGIESIEFSAVSAGWFSSEMYIDVNGTFFSADGRAAATRRGVLHINHGPVIWHLSDTLLALADIQLLSADSSSDRTQHLSGSAIVRLTRALSVQTKAIVGIHASGGEHWLELYSSVPLIPDAAGSTGRLWLDLDIEALNNAGLSGQTEKWLMNETARVSNNRLLFSAALQ